MRQCILIIFFALQALSCNNLNSNKAKIISTQISLANVKSTIGDCFTFQDNTLNSFGLILIENETNEYSFVPVKLNQSDTGITRFIKGQVYFNSYPDLANKNKNIQGMNTFVFTNKTDIDWIFKQIKKKGNLKIKTSYLSITGGTIALSIDEFKRALNNWQIIFSNNGKLIYVSQMI